MDYLKHELLGEELWLLPQKGLFWPKNKLLVIADLHVGKSGHFRKWGIPISSQILQKDLNSLDYLINFLKPKSTLFLGDLYHSKKNREFETLKLWMINQPTDFILVKGNHDTIDFLKYLPLTINEGKILMPPFVFSHQVLSGVTHYNITGHLHPATVIKGNAKQSIKLSCFWFSQNFAVLPAFGSFTGSHIIKVAKEDKVFCVSEKSVDAC